MKKRGPRAGQVTGESSGAEGKQGSREGHALARHWWSSGLLRWRVEGLSLPEPEKQARASELKGPRLCLRERGSGVGSEAAVPLLCSPWRGREGQQWADKRVCSLPGNQTRAWAYGQTDTRPLVPEGRLPGSWAGLVAVPGPAATADGQQGPPTCQARGLGASTDYILR